MATRLGSRLLSKSVGAGTWSLFGVSIPKTAPWNWWQMDMQFNRGRNGVVYSCVQAYAQTIAQLPFQHKRNLPSGGTELITSSALSRILRKPNAYQSRSDFLLNLVASLFYEGNAYALPFRNDRGEVDSLHLVHPKKCSPLVVPESGEIFYQATLEDVAGEQTTRVLVPQRDMMHIRLYCPDHPLVGETPIVAAAASISVNDSIEMKQSAFFANMSRPSGVLTTDEKLGSKEVQELRERWEQMSQGINTGHVPILSWGLKWQPLSLSDKDAQLVDSLKMSVEDIARVFRVPLPIVGSTENTTYDNVQNLLQFWKSSGLGFVLNHIEVAYADFFRLNEKPDQFTEFDMDALMRADLLTRVDALTKGITGGLYAPNEARSKENLPAVKGGEKPLVQQQMVPVGYEPPTPAPPADPPPSSDPKEPEEQETSVDELYVALKMATGFSA